MRPVLAALVAVALATPLATAAPQPPPTTLLTLSGNGSSYVDVMLPRSVPLRYGSPDFPTTGFSGWTWRGCGAYRGYFLQPLEHRMHGVGAIDFAAFDYAPGQRGALPVGAPHFVPNALPAGRTRVYLLAAGPCTLSVRIPGGGGGSLSLRTTHAALARVAVTGLGATGSAVLPEAGTARWDVAVGPRTLLMAYARTHMDGPGAENTTASVACPGTGIAAPRVAGVPGVLPGFGGSGDHASTTVLTYLPGTLPAATCTLVAAGGGTPAARSAAGYVALDVAEPSAPGASPPCVRVTSSPSYARDHTVACATTDAVYVSTDGGRRWRRAGAGGLTTSPTVPPRSIELVFSARYDTDRTLYAHAGAGLYASTDLGDTFVLADPGAAVAEVPWSVEPSDPPGSNVPGVPLVPFVHAGPTGDAAALAWAERSAWLLRPELRARTPMFPSVDGLTGVAVPQRFPAGDDAMVVTRTATAAGTPPQRHTIHTCHDELTCTVRFDVPVTDRAWEVVDTWVGGDPGRRTMQLVLRGEYDGATAWRSLDGGRTFASWSSLALLLLRDDRDADRPDFALAHNPALPHRVYARVSRVHSDAAPHTVPDEAVFRSDDDGTTWRRVSAGWSSARGGPRGTVPWGGFVAAGGFGQFEIPSGGRGTFELAADGTLLATGWVRGTRRPAVFRSTDGGVHWHEARG